MTNNYFHIKVNPDNILQYTITSNMYIWEDFLYSYKAKKYLWGLKKWTISTEKETITENWQENDVEETFNVYRGFAIYIYNKYREYLDEDELHLLENDIWCNDDWVNQFDYSGLRDDQISVVRELLRYKHCIIQITTGFGKTEIIARLIIQFINAGKKVLVTTSLKKVVDEIKLRVWKYAPEMYIPDYWDTDSKLNIINPQGFANSYSFDENDPFFKDVDLVLCDEVSSSTTDSSWSVYQLILNQECRFIGFDATAEKELGDRLDIQENLNCIHSANSVYVIDLFGMSWLFDKPKDYIIDIVNVTSIGLREICVDINNQQFSETSVYRDICNFIFSHPEYINSVDYVIKKYGKLFIPINDLEYINTMCELFDGKYSIVTITGEGYWSNKEGWIDLERVKYLTQENKVQLLMSTKSGFKGLDFRGIPNVLLTLGSKAGEVIQFVGRVARQKHFRIIVITPGGKWKLPIYTSTNIKQLNLILNYYEECEINFVEDNYE